MVAGSGDGGSNDITTGGPLKNKGLQMERECGKLKNNAVVVSIMTV